MTIEGNPRPPAAPLTVTRTTTTSETEQQPDFPGLDLYLQAHASGDRLTLSCRDILERLGYESAEREELIADLDALGFLSSTSLWTCGPDEQVEIRVTDPPPLFILRAQVDNTRGAVPATVEQLLLATERQRLTEAARQEIEDALAEVGLVAQPDLWSVDHEDVVALRRADS